MDTATISPTCIAALVDERGEFGHVTAAAVDLAAEKGARLLLYDISSASAFREPVASEMSAEGVGEEYGPLLSDADLETLGHHDLAEQGRHARGAGRSHRSPGLASVRRTGVSFVVPAPFPGARARDRKGGARCGSARRTTSWSTWSTSNTCWWSWRRTRGPTSSGPTPSVGSPRARASSTRWPPRPPTARRPRRWNGWRRASRRGIRWWTSGTWPGGRGPAGRTCPDLGASHGETPGVERERTTGQPPGQSRWARTARGRGGRLKSNASRKSPAMRSLGPRGGSPWRRSIIRSTEENSSVAESTDRRRAHGEITMAGTRGPRPYRSTWGGATWS